ncbi:hypothetical protein vBRpoSV10_209 [Ruegeria phage vB_RpoS-V10]|nr:hypothetical protein DSS3P8_204 [Roseobacter phage DSS3P8]AWY09331.1 hypothetical protein vBRpoSV10_209 [Ruegeria phage vB_RpoS-V10]
MLPNTLIICRDIAQREHIRKSAPPTYLVISEGTSLYGRRFDIVMVADGINMDSNWFTFGVRTRLMATGIILRFYEVLNA